MRGRENANGTWSENKVEEEKNGDSLRTVNCLRGRLLAERLASRNAAKEAHLLQTKVEELEHELNEETKAIKRAEKKLKFLMKRLENVESCFGNVEDHTTPFVSAEMVMEEKRINDGEVIDMNVKQVLESLNNAKHQILSSMEKRRSLKMMNMSIIKVG